MAKIIPMNVWPNARVNWLNIKVNVMAVQIFVLAQESIYRFAEVTERPTIINVWQNVRAKWLKVVVPVEISRYKC